VLISSFCHQTWPLHSLKVHLQILKTTFVFGAGLRHLLGQRTFKRDADGSKISHSTQSKHTTNILTNITSFTLATMSKTLNKQNS